MSRPVPIGSDVAQRQPDQLRAGFIGRKVSTALDDTSSLILHALKRGRGVNHTSHFRRKGVERNDVLPRLTPHLDDRRKASAHVVCKRV